MGDLWNSRDGNGVVVKRDGCCLKKGRCDCGTLILPVTENAYLTISSVEKEKEPCPLITNSVPSKLSGIRGRFVVVEGLDFAQVEGGVGCGKGSLQQRKRRGA
jgi:hypothetical protein